MLAGHPERHVWGLGRHYAGSNFFWYLKDPAGNFSEYYSDMDCIIDDQLWTPEALEGARGLFSWGPPPPPSFLAPGDLAALMTGSHCGLTRRAGVARRRRRRRAFKGADAVFWLVPTDRHRPPEAAYVDFTRPACSSSGPGGSSASGAR